nr:uncharacterized protein LOC128669171 [Plodia interpunctella]
MKTYTLTSIVVVLAILHIGKCTVQYFEFGVDAPVDRVIKTIEGNMGLQKTKIIPLDIPPCYIVTYVKVIVDNWFSTPKVDFDSKTNTVTISYTLLANDISHYTIIVKGYKDPNCFLSRLRLHP